MNFPTVQRHRQTHRHFYTPRLFLDPFELDSNGVYLRSIVAIRSARVAYVVER